MPKILFKLKYFALQSTEQRKTAKIFSSSKIVHVALLRWKIAGVAVCGGITQQADLWSDRSF